LANERSGTTMKMLIVEDDRSIVETMRLCLEMRWPGSIILDTGLGQDGIATAAVEKPDVIILDIGLPDINGFDVLRQMRMTSAVPVVIVTVRDQESDMIMGFELGADDYITKPFSHIEFLARIHAVLRRVNGAEIKRRHQVFVSGNLSIDFTRRQVRLYDDLVRLTPLEYNLLSYLVDNVGQTVSYTQIIERIWGPEQADAIDYLRAYIGRLREKLEDNAESPKYIANVRREGYLFKQTESIAVLAGCAS
jgi:DNA-binding response OmpR family regulator